MSTGTWALGTLAWGELPPMSNPTVTVFFPALEEVISTGPEYTFEWTYGHDHSGQGSYRIRFYNDAGTTLLHDSGWTESSSTSVSYDLVAAGIAGDSTDVSVQIGVRTVLGARFEGTSGLRPFQLEMGTPTVAITSPASDGNIDRTSVALTWTFSDSQGGSQGLYQIQAVRGAVTILDTGEVVSAVHTATPDLLLGDGLSYTFRVRAANTNGVWSEWDEVHLTADLLDPTQFPDLASVGRVYEVGINGSGYMLYEKPGDQDAWQRTMVQLDVPRFATSETPFSEAVDRYVFTGWPSFRGGNGQLWADRPDSSPSRYWDSSGVNPFGGVLELLPSASLEVGTTYASCRAVVASDKLYVQTGARAFKHVSTPGGSETSLDVSAAIGADIVDVCSDGQYVYETTGTNIYRHTTVAPGSAWSTIDAKTISWAGQRICATYTTSGSTGNTWTTLDKTGAEEVALGRLILDPGWTIGKSTGNTGFLWFPAYASYRGVVYVWRVGSTDTPRVAWELPAGMRPVSVFAYQNQVMVLAQLDNETTTLFRCQVVGADSADGGALDPQLVCEDLPFTSSAFGADARFVLFAWPSIENSKDGLGAVDLSSGGGCRWMHATGGGGQVRTIGLWKGRTYWTSDAVGCYLEDDGDFLTSGWLETSLTDKNSSIQKVWDTATVQCIPLRTGETITVEATFDQGTSYEPVYVMRTIDERNRTVSVTKRAQSAGLKVTLGGDGSSTPSISLLQLRCHPVGVADEVLRMPIACFDQLSDLKGKALASNRVGKGVQIYLELKSLEGSRAKVQDITWPVTGTSEIWEVLSVDAKAANLYDRNLGRAGQGLIAVITLRRLVS